MDWQDLYRSCAQKEEAVWMWNLRFGTWNDSHRQKILCLLLLQCTKRSVKFAIRHYIRTSMKFAYQSCNEVRSKESDSNQKSKLNVKRSLCVKHVEKDLLQIMCYKIILFNVRLFLHIRLNSGGKKHFLCSICNKQFDIVFNLLIQRNRPRGPEEKNFVNMHLLNMCSFSAEPNMSHLSDLHSYWI